jgi:hypothetical protein
VESGDCSDFGELQRIALDLPRLTLTDLSEALGESRGSLEKYRCDDTEMPPIIKHRLAEFLREHASALIRLASELDRSS